MFDLFNRRRLATAKAIIQKQDEELTILRTENEQLRKLKSSVEHGPITIDQNNASHILERTKRKLQVSHRRQLIRNRNPRATKVFGIPVAVKRIVPRSMKQGERSKKIIIRKSSKK